MKRWMILLGASLLAMPVYAGEDEGEAPAEEAPAEEAPADEEPSEEAPAEEAPAEEAPAEEPPTEEPPAEEAPAAEPAPPASEPETDATPAPDPKMEKMKEHMQAFLDLPAPPLELQLPHNFTVQPMLQLQVLATAFDMDDPERNDPIVHGDGDRREGASIRRARFGLAADWNDVLGISILAGWTDRYDALAERGPPVDLVEAVFTFTPGQVFNVRAGYGRTEVGRQAMIGSNDLTLAERAMVSEKMGSTREPGVAFTGALGPEGNDKVPSNAFQYGVSITSGTMDLGGDLDPSPRIAGRLRLDLFDEWVNAEVDHEPGMFGLSVGGGANYHWGLEAETLTAGFDLGLRVWRFTIMGELMYGNATPTFDTESLPDFLAGRESLGWYGQLTAAIIPWHLEATIRVEGYDDHTGLQDGGDRLDIVGGVGLYLFKTRLKLHVDYIHREELTEGYATDNDSLIIQMQARL